MLMGIPLVWFFVGRALPDRITIGRLQYATAFLAGVIAIYGLYQTQVGFPRWDLAWIDVGGYSVPQRRRGSEGVGHLRERR